jgi:hypothetical protein
VYQRVLVLETPQRRKQSWLQHVPEGGGEGEGEGVVVVVVVVAGWPRG